jgi:hypothetical protein
MKLTPQMIKKLNSQKWAKNILKKLLKRVNMVKLAVLLLLVLPCTSFAWTDNQIADAIYLAEGGAKTSHPYGILAHYKHTSPRNACLNTIRNQRARHTKHNCGKEFLVCLRDRYCPIGCDNDNGSNKFWLINVKYFLDKRG